MKRKLLLLAIIIYSFWDITYPQIGSLIPSDRRVD